MTNQDYILRHIHHHPDPFVNDLYRELDQRIRVMEEGGGEASVESMKMKDAWLPTIVTALITVFFIYSIVSH